MNEKRQVEIDTMIAELSMVWRSAPNLRFGQFLECVLGSEITCMFYMDEDEFTEKLLEFGEKTGAFGSSDEEE